MLEIGSMYSEIFETTDPGAASTYIKFGNTTIGATSMAGSGLDGESNTIYEFNIFDDFIVMNIPIIIIINPIIICISLIRMTQIVNSLFASFVYNSH